MYAERKRYCDTEKACHDWVQYITRRAKSSRRTIKHHLSSLLNIFILCRSSGTRCWKTHISVFLSVNLVWFCLVSVFQFFSFLYFFVFFVFFLFSVIFFMRSSFFQRFRPTFPQTSLNSRPKTKQHFQTDFSTTKNARKKSEGAKELKI